MRPSKPRHPRAVPNVVPERATDPEAEAPFTEGARDELDPDLRHRLISEAAHALYVQRGYRHGYDLDDWLQAEAAVDHMLLERPVESVQTQ